MLRRVCCWSTRGSTPSRVAHEIFHTPCPRLRDSAPLLSLPVLGWLAVAVLTTVLVAQFVQAWPVRHIPGPFSFPLIGNVPHLMWRPWARVLQFSRVHGGVFKVYVIAAAVRPCSTGVWGRVRVAGSCGASRSCSCLTLTP